MPIKIPRRIAFVAYVSALASGVMLTLFAKPAAACPTTGCVYAGLCYGNGTVVSGQTCSCVQSQGSTNCTWES